MNVERKVFVTFLVVLGLAVSASAPAVRDLGSVVGSFVLELVHPGEPMPVAVTEQLIGEFPNPCGDGYNARVTIGRLADGALAIFYFLHDDLMHPWGVVVRGGKVYLDFDRDGDAEEVLEGQNVFPCDVHPKVIKKGPPAEVTTNRG